MSLISSGILGSVGLLQGHNTRNSLEFLITRVFLGFYKIVFVLPQLRYNFHRSRLSPRKITYISCIFLELIYREDYISVT